uniref:Phosphoribosylformylglycinamidine synthase subunit PurQ n=1 Tax=Chlorobium chlorochromatii (strain CaD3) TaxID=340177 RepID=PURQ_CHLCH|nr:RecName: Full=Phosphoribosylformylglycinamidine synthase subunit PurQ; Short=FGAM synthase; AltName: Full=Formylglycinamide ribonucleotide amidotransferase subunit I; Short=FGAR amidotransferase I; Short=FGAR-AT I; AltName: Full=Glutaminase PurQ; AltName: Full=Phosphoribosylformylglycinamidine synthase subunit I [Chlorobium chlorochromatii CaD3]
MSAITVGVVVFPGSNCDHDTAYALASFAGVKPVMLWHNNHDLQGAQAIVLPGGFSYGDYLRAGAIARFSPLMKEVVEFARKGYPVLGICNGFQVLLESGLLEGALSRNRDKKFLCCQTTITPVNCSTRFTEDYHQGEVLRIPIAHGEGNYFAPPEVLESLQEHNQIAFQYCNAQGEVTVEANPNGSLLNIAGIVNRAGNVLGLMPHPERASDAALGSVDGRLLFESLFRSLTGV